MDFNFSDVLTWKLSFIPRFGAVKCDVLFSFILWNWTSLNLKNVTNTFRRVHTIKEIFSQKQQWAFVIISSWNCTCLWRENSNRLNLTRILIDCFIVRPQF
uniref:Uncharacterized protein n=1 Tax=Cucumis sativus TaxID=3659 RepID=A0A0A0KWX1_CUCSA